MDAGTRPFRALRDDRSTEALAGALIAGACLAVTIGVSAQSFYAGIGVAGVVGLGVWLVLSPHYERSLAVLLLYLALADGYLKLRFGGQGITFARDLLLYAIVAGALVRLSLRREPIDLPPLTGFVLAWGVICLAQVFNPAGGTWMHSVQALRPVLEFAPLFFFGYALLRSAGRLRVFFVLLVVAAAVNGAVGLVQSELTPDQLAGWGPGYSRLINGGGDGTGVSGRVAVTEVDGQRTEQVRPMALGSDIGFGGALAVVAIPGMLALLAFGRGARRAQLLSVVLGVLVLVGLITSQTRLAVLMAVLAVALFIVYGAVSGRVYRLLAVLVVAGAVLAIAISQVSNSSRGGVFNRYESIAGTKALSTSVDYKQGTIAGIPDNLGTFPLGAGLGTIGPGASTQGGRTDRPVIGESFVNFLILETGIPGLLLLTALSLSVMGMAFRGIRRVADRDTQLLLAGLAAPFATIFIAWPGAVLMAGTPFSPYFWFAAGGLVYWCHPRSSRVA